jgi:hypothetical protein
VAANWSGGVAPASGTSIGTLTFPTLTAGARAVNLPATPTIVSGRCINDLTGLSVGTLAINDADLVNAGQTYGFSGSGITIATGLPASPGSTASNGFNESTLALPITLGAPQTSTLTGNPGVIMSGQPIYTYGLAVDGAITGPTGLNHHRSRCQYDASPHVR